MPASVTKVLKALGKTARKEVASATALVIPNGHNDFTVTGTTAVTSLTARRDPGRVIRLMGATGASVTVTDTAPAAAAEGTIAIPSGNFSMGKYDQLLLKQLADYSWVAIGNAQV